MKIKLITDSSCDLSLSYIKENNIDLIPLKVNVEGEFINDDLGESLKYDWLYKKMRDGVLPKTAQANAYEFEDVFRRNIEGGYSIICLTIAGVLSGTYNSANIAKNSILEEFPHADITVIDSTSVTVGLGSLVYYTNELIKEGKNKCDIIDWIEKNKIKVNLAVTIDDLVYLKNGGRISSTTALVGGLLNIKPTISLDSEGKLVQGIKIKGRKKAIKYLVNEVKEKGIDLSNQILFISHGDCYEDAEALKKMILDEIDVKDVMINYMGSTIGCHGGPGALVVEFLGQERK